MRNIKDFDSILFSKYFTDKEKKIFYKQFIEKYHSK
jgi:hypothetical protein